MIGIREETKNRWERRVPLTPEQVGRLIAEHGVEVRVQPSALRAFPDDAFRDAGAQVDADLTPCTQVFGVKEIPPERLVAGQAYAFFAHVTKGQDYNMPMLARLRELGCTLVDYEEIRDDGGRRLVFFGRHAGYAGMIDGLWALGRRLEHEGLHSPLGEIRPTLDYASLAEAREHLSSIGRRLSGELPSALPCLKIAFTGGGHVTSGAREILDLLPVRYVDPEALPSATAEAAAPVIATVLRRSDRYRRRSDGGFDLDEFDAHADRYTSGLEPLLPHLHLVVHGAFWAAHQPRLITADGLRELWSSGRRSLRVIADISCDIEGGLATTVRPTTPGEPTYVFEPATGGSPAGIAGEGPVVLAVDNLPCELPIDASNHFGEVLSPFALELARCRWQSPLQELELSPPLRRALILHRGTFTPEYAHLERYLES